jgi:membrane-associated phospholipid phosphatase
MPQLTRYFLFFALFFPTVLQAQQTTDSLSVAIQDTIPAKPPVRPDWNYVKSYWTDTKAVVSRPFHWKGQDWKTVGIVGGVAALSYFVLDKRIQTYSQNHRTPFTNTTSAIVDPLGNGRTLWITSGLVFLHGQVFKNPKTTRVGLLILESQLINGIIGQVLKLSFGRARPYESGVADQWYGPRYPVFTSFPSGHAQTSFALATAIALEFRHVKIVPPIAYTLATLTCLSRINANAHWTSDLIVGAALGHFITKTIIRQHPEDSSKPINTSFYMTPGGMGMVHTF